MEFSTKAGTPEKLKSSCVVVGVYADGKLTPSGTSIDAASGGNLSKAIKRGDQRGVRGSSLLLTGLTGIQAERVLLVGLGKQGELGEKAYTEAVRAALRGVIATGAEDLLFTLAEVSLRTSALQSACRASRSIGSINSRARKKIPFDSRRSSSRLIRAPRRKPVRVWPKASHSPTASS